VIAGRIAGAVVTGLGRTDAVALAVTLGAALALDAALAVVSTEADVEALGAIAAAAAASTTFVVGVSLHADAVSAKSAARDARPITLAGAARTRAPQNGHASLRT
jgi:hypothetical protein